MEVDVLSGHICVVKCHPERPRLSPDGPDHQDCPLKVRNLGWFGSSTFRNRISNDPFGPAKPLMISVLALGGCAHNAAAVPKSTRARRSVVLLVLIWFWVQRRQVAGFPSD